VRIRPKGNTFHSKTFSHTACRLDKLHVCNSRPRSARSAISSTWSTTDDDPRAAGCDLVHVDDNRRRPARGRVRSRPPGRQRASDLPRQGAIWSIWTTTGPRTSRGRVRSRPRGRQRALGGPRRAGQAHEKGPAPLGGWGGTGGALSRWEAGTGSPQEHRSVSAVTTGAASRHTRSRRFRRPGDEVPPDLASCLTQAYVSRTVDTAGSTD